MFGLAFGAIFAAAGFNPGDVIHRMLLLEDLTPFPAMGLALMTGMAMLWALPAVETDRA